MQHLPGCVSRPIDYLYFSLYLRTGFSLIFFWQHKSTVAIVAHASHLDASFNSIPPLQLRDMCVVVLGESNP